LAEFNNINALALKMGNSPKLIEKLYRQGVRPKEAHEFWKIAPKRPASRKVVVAIRVSNPAVERGDLSPNFATGF